MKGITGKFRTFTRLFLISRWIKFVCRYIYGFPGSASGKESACQCRRHKRCRFYPWVGRFPVGGNGSPLWYSCLENSTDRRAWWVTVHRVAKSQTQLKWLGMCMNAHAHRHAHTHTHTHTHIAVKSFYFHSMIYRQVMNENFSYQSVLCNFHL